MRTAILLLTVMVALLVGSGVALAAVISCPTGPGGECRGTRFADQITGTMGVDQIYALGGDDAVQGANRASLREPLAFMTTCEVAMSQFCQSVLQRHTTCAVL